MTASARQGAIEAPPRDSGRASRADPRVARSRAKLLDAATELLVDGGVSAVTVDAVAARSGVSKSTLYRHSPSNTTLLVEVLHHNVPDLDIDVPPGGFADGVRALVHGFAFAMDNADWARILPSLLTLKSALPDVHALTDGRRSTVLDSVRTVVERGVSEGVLTPQIDLTTTMNLLIGPLVLATLDHDLHRLTDLADEISDRYIASCTRSNDR